MREHSFKDYILDQLIDVESVRAKGMFGGFGLYAGDIFFGIISDDVVYLKTNVHTRKKFLEAGMKPFAPSEKQVLKNYYEVPEEIIDDVEKLSEWALDAIDVGKAGK